MARSRGRRRRAPAPLQAWDSSSERELLMDQQSTDFLVLASLAHPAGVGHRAWRRRASQGVTTVWQQRMQRLGGRARRRGGILRP